jgi:hypothetical protein
VAFVRRIHSWPRLAFRDYSQKQRAPRYAIVEEFDHFRSGIEIALLWSQETNNMEATQVSIQSTPCCGPLPDLEIPMVNTMVACLGYEHRKLSGHVMRLALAATRLAADPDAAETHQRAVEVWDEIRRDLWSHLQIEDELVFSWGEARRAIPNSLVESLKLERQEMHKLVAKRPRTAASLRGCCSLWPARSTRTSSAMMAKSCPPSSAHLSTDSMLGSAGSGRLYQSSRTCGPDFASASPLRPPIRPHVWPLTARRVD